MEEQMHNLFLVLNFPINYSFLQIIKYFITIFIISLDFKLLIKKESLLLLLGTNYYSYLEVNKCK